MVLHDGQNVLTLHATAIGDPTIAAVQQALSEIINEIRLCVLEFVQPPRGSMADSESFRRP
jgi:hypothetical protein